MIKTKFVTPNGLYKEVDSETISCLSSDGWRCVLQNHMPLVLMLEISRLETVENKKKEYYAIGGGMLYFNNNEATVLVNSIESKDEIDKDRALNAKKRAEERINSKDENIDMIRASVALKRALNRLELLDR